MVIFYSRCCGFNVKKYHKSLLLAWLKGLSDSVSSKWGNKNRYNNLCLHKSFKKLFREKTPLLLSSQCHLIREIQGQILGLVKLSNLWLQGVRWYCPRTSLGAPAISKLVGRFWVDASVLIVIVACRDDKVVSCAHVSVLCFRSLSHFSRFSF